MKKIACLMNPLLYNLHGNEKNNKKLLLPNAFVLRSVKTLAKPINSKRMSECFPQEAYHPRLQLAEWNMHKLMNIPGRSPFEYWKRLAVTSLIINNLMHLIFHGTLKSPAARFNPSCIYYFGCNIRLALR